MATSGPEKWSTQPTTGQRAWTTSTSTTSGANPDTNAPGGVLHLVLAVLASGNDEAESLGRAGKCVVILHSDCSVSVADDGRGTDTRRGSNGEMAKKPVMATEDLRFFDNPNVVLLPDGTPRRGMSVVSALSHWRPPLVTDVRPSDGTRGTGAVRTEALNVEAALGPTLSGAHQPRDLLLVMCHAPGWSAKQGWMDLTSRPDARSLSRARRASQRLA